VAGLESLRGRRVLIVGTGREASALANRLLDDAIASSIVAIDGRDGDSATVWRDTFGMRVPLHIVTPTEGLIPADVAQCEVAVVSPGIPKTGDLYAWIMALGISVSSATALFVADYAQTMVGVTGSKGKSTTSTLIHHLLQGSGVRATLSGNMGIPAQSVDPGDVQVVELSSYQCSYLRVSPSVVVLTALFPEHLDWHGSQEAYYNDKLSIVAGEPRRVVANADDPILSTELRSRYPDLEVEWVGEGHHWHTEPEGEGGAWLMQGATRVAHSSDLTLVGAHNRHNALLAIAGAHATGLLNLTEVPALLRSFSPLANRLEAIDDPSGVVFINDSLATNPQAAIAALRAFPAEKTIILVGGLDRGVDYSPLVDYIQANPPRALIGLPDSGERLVELCRGARDHAGIASTTHMESVTAMETAVRVARSLAREGDYVLLSPGAPSFGQYRDYQHRADDFIAWIRQTQENPA
jgi:UDP-N-acetylmuramoyl-L-alanine---L-glutamate ligase